MTYRDICTVIIFVKRLLSRLGLGTKTTLFGFRRDYVTRYVTHCLKYLTNDLKVTMNIHDSQFSRSSYLSHWRYNYGLVLRS